MCGIHRKTPRGSHPSYFAYIMDMAAVEPRVFHEEKTGCFEILNFIKMRKLCVFYIEKALDPVIVFHALLY